MKMLDDGKNDTRDEVMRFIDHWSWGASLAAYIRPFTIQSSDLIFQ